MKKELRYMLAIIFPNIIKNIFLMIKYNCFIHPFANINFIHNLRIGKGTIIQKCSIYAQNKITIGKNCKIEEGVILNSKTGHIIIGYNTEINQKSIIFGNGGVDIGHDCAISPNVQIIKNHIIPLLNKNYGCATENKTIIGNYVWLCSNVVVIDGVKIGNNAIIGANAFVNKDVPKNVIAVGIPIKILRKRK